MDKRDRYTTTESDAAAYEYHHADPPDNDYPTLAECEADEHWMRGGS